MNRVTGKKKETVFFYLRSSFIYIKSSKENFYLRKSMLQFLLNATSKYY